MRRRALITGMSGTGKSTVIGELAARGHRAIDLDAPEWSELVAVPGHPGISASAPGLDWVWREDRVGRLLDAEDARDLFVAGCASNQGRFAPRFDRVVLLTAPVPLMVERLATRTGNAYGRHPDELARVLQFTRTIEPLLRRRATLELDTSAPLDRVVAAILAHARA